uniref:Isoform 2 of ADP-ribosylation factor-like protein 2-binding protein n=1 Tax=Xenopus laevis TaxID=8355 RepID=Q6DDX7-2|nr:MGC84796 protein [Xenopus laevis]
MEDLEEENFSLSVSSPKDAEFDNVVGHLEDIIMDDEFQLLQHGFMDKHYHEFEDTEENKLTYTTIFNEYVSCKLNLSVLLPYLLCNLSTLRFHPVSVTKNT